MSARATALPSRGIDHAEMLRALRAFQSGDFAARMPVDLTGIDGKIAQAFNEMVTMNAATIGEISRICELAGKEGEISERAGVSTADNPWTRCVSSVNKLVSSLARPIAEVVRVMSAANRGDLSQRILIDAHGEILVLQTTINTLLDRLNALASEVSRVAREVATDGRLGGRAQMPGAAGTWKELIDSVNLMSASLTSEVRSFASMVSAVTNGDLDRKLVVEGRGEMAALKDNINQMIAKLADTTRKNTEQDWQKTNLAHFSRVLQGHRELTAASEQVLSELAPLVGLQQGVVYTRNAEDHESRFALLAFYAVTPGPAERLPVHEHLIEKSAHDKLSIALDGGPGACLSGSARDAAQTAPRVMILPVMFGNKVKAVLELCSITQFSASHVDFLENLTDVIGIAFNTIESNMRTESLLGESQLLTAEFENQKEKLQRSNRRLRDDARQMSGQVKQVKDKNMELELAGKALEVEAEQLTMNSRYKSELLANMSHELRTPLNSLLIMAQLLAENPAGNLTPKQTEYVRTISAVGSDLVAYINDVLDLAKIESGTVTLHVTTEPFQKLLDHLEGTFNQIAHEKALKFSISMRDNVPAALRTDEKRLQQILVNLLSNAVKFTARGAVSLEIAIATSGWTSGHPIPDDVETVVAFAVTDTGIGIAPNKQKIIFEAFRQADGTISRHFGGTGLGLSISASLSRLLGGEITLNSTPGKGSTFTLYIPLVLGPDEKSRNGGSTRVLGVDRMLPAADADGGTRNRERRSGIDERLQWPVHEHGVAFSTGGGDEQLPLNGATANEPPVLERSPARTPGIHPELNARKVLLIEDDIRNLFALTCALERQGMMVMTAENGMDGIALLNQNPEIDIVVIDMIMPELDGYDTIRLIRAQERFVSVPIIGVSARAIKGDREKCIGAGASDYIAKPVRVAHLLSIMRIWLIPPG